MGKKLFQIFGPIVLAAILVFAIFASPINFGISKFNRHEQKEAAVSLAPNILKGKHIKQVAMDDGFVPFFGSSEWSRFDPMHPSVLAEKYHRSYRPFLMGARGTQSLTQYFVMQNIQPQLKNKKAVFVISPQWFVKQGTRKDAFGFYYSQLQTTEWLKQEKNSAMDRYAAQRLLDMPSAASDHVIHNALVRVADGKSITGFQRGYMGMRQNILAHEDSFFSGISLTGGNFKKVNKYAKQLPEKDDDKQIDELAVKLGKADTTSNDFGISNEFYNGRLKHSLKHLAGFQKNLDYTKSPEFADFQLALNQFAKNHTDVMFVIPPINQKWADYTGLSLDMIKQFDKKIHYQLQSQGFNNIADLTEKGSDPYFMTDTIHLGWRGWLAADKRIDPFLTKKQKSPKYKINDKFYSEKWQQLDPSDLDQYKAEK